ncbi:hypothetical protein QR680_016735 [Steinernema hermaphroditum]|uniref:Uncharacterized protein n=1 Tax=Steinernema hermaphroditum TaxID=289476 RepID=A0AA39HC55_9BILA|nr:hypothetical protein QR680_016735 [Steinernema hermaphroditum]
MMASTSQPPVTKVPLEKQLIQVPLTHGRYVRYFSNASEMESSCCEEYDEALHRRRCLRTTLEISLFVLLLILLITAASIGMAHRRN